MTSVTAIATIKTNLGNIRVNLLGNHAPKTVKNFVELALGQKEWTHPLTNEKSSAPLYNGVVFHRIIEHFMIQGGDPIGNGTGGPGYNFNDEIHPELNFEEPYVLAMANAGLQRNALTGELEGTNGSQFFITTVPTPWLLGKHTIFGLIEDEKSRAVVDKIEQVATDGRDRPLDDVVIESIEVEEL